MATAAPSPPGAPDQPAPAPASTVSPPTAGNGGGNPPDANAVQPKWRLWHSLSLLLIIVAIGVLGVTQPPYLAFLGTLALLAAFTAIAGNGIVGFWLGALIDERNKMSLSRLQMVLWTIVVLSGFLTAALRNVSVGSSDPLKIAVPKEIWLVMGISTTTLVGSPLIRSTKTAEPSETGLPQQVIDRRAVVLERTKEELVRQGMRKNTILAQGSIVVWKWPRCARLSDLFQGDQIAGAAQLDLGKIQMFFFTLALVFTYVVALAAEFSNAAGPVHSFPALGESMVALLGISHAGYLANNAVPRTGPA